jgi:hypothetical protein
LEVSLQGFRTYIQTGIVLQVDAAPVINAVLGVGAVEESVTVEAASPLVDVLNSGLSEVVQNEEVLALPLNGRNAADLIALAGAAVRTGESSSRSIAGGVAYSVAGGLNFGVAYQLDGAMHNDPHNNLNLPLPFPDALQEFRVATSGLSAGDAHGGVGQRCDPVGYEPFLRQRVRVLPRQGVQRARTLCPGGAGRQTGG